MNKHLIIILLFLAVIPGCKDTYDPFGYEFKSCDWSIEQSEHLVCHYFSYDSSYSNPEQAKIEIDSMLIELETFIIWFCGFFNVDFTGKQINCYKYITEADFEKATGREYAVGCAYIDKNREIHTYYKYSDWTGLYKHEIIHILSFEVNYPSIILSEGLAERYEDHPKPSYLLHRDVAVIIREENFIPIENGTTSYRFDKISSDSNRVLRKEFASWTAYLIDTYGIDKFREFFKETTRDNIGGDDIFNTIYRIYCKMFDEMETEWIDYVKKVSPEIVCSTRRQED